MAVIQHLLWLEKMVPQGQVDEFSGAQHIDMLRQSVLPMWPPLPGAGQPDSPSTSLSAAFQGPGAQPRAQLPVHLCQRAQRSAGPLQVRLCGERATGGWEQGLTLTPLLSQPLQREQPEAVCG